MKRLIFRLAGFCFLGVLTAVIAAPPLRAQEGPPQGGGEPAAGRMGMGGLFENSAHGTVTTISGSEITIRDEQGDVYKVLTGPNTHFRKDREEAKFSDIHPGDTIVAAGNLDTQAKTVGAVFVVVLSPEQAARMEKMREDFGKTWTAGKVTAIDGLTLTVERPDHQSQTITVDENTEFHKRREDITFPDIKVGDMVRATGALQNGSFLAKTVNVMEPGQRRFGEHQPGVPPSEVHPAGQPEGTPSGAPATPQPNGPQN